MPSRPYHLSSHTTWLAPQHAHSCAPVCLRSVQALRQAFKKVVDNVIASSRDGVPPALTADEIRAEDEAHARERDARRSTPDHASLPPGRARGHEDGSDMSHAYVIYVDAADQYKEYEAKMRLKSDSVFQDLRYNACRWVVLPRMGDGANRGSSY